MDLIEVDEAEARSQVAEKAAEAQERLEDSRELGAAESLTEQVHQFGGLIAGGVLRISGRLTPELVRRGLDWLQDEHPILRAHLAFRGVKFISRFPYIQPRFVFETRGTRPIPLRSVIDASPGAGLRALQEELRKKIPVGPLPRMKAVLVRSHEEAEQAELITCADHTIADVQSAMLATNQLLSFLGDPERTRAPRGRRSRLPPSIDTVMPKKSNGGGRYRPMIRLPIEKHPKTEVGTAIERRGFSRAETDLLKSRAKAQRTSLHGVVTAAILKGIHARFAMPEMTVLSSVDLRRFCKPAIPPDVYGCFIDIVRTRHRIDQPLWELSRDVSTGLITTVARDHENASALRLPSWEMLKTETLPLLRSGFRADGLVMTTSGESDLKRNYGAIVLEDAGGMISQEVVGAGFFGFALEKDGALEFTLCYAPHCLAPLSAAAVADTAAAILRHPG